MIIRVICQPEIAYQAAGPMAEIQQVLAAIRDQVQSLSL
jgi:hypothetical protein